MDVANHDQSLPTQQLVNSDNSLPTRYKKGTLPSTFLTNTDAVAKCEGLISELLEKQTNQDNIDKIYGDFVKIYHDELSLHLKELDKTSKSKRTARHSCKPFWTPELTELWECMHLCEKCNVKFQKNAHGYRAMKDRFNLAQKKV